MKKSTLLLLLGIILTPSLFAQFSIQKVVMEEFTGAWCGYCPDGAVVMEGLLENNPKVFAASIHTNDAMTIPVGDSIADFFTSSFPSATFNRAGDAIGRGSWVSAAQSAQNGASSVTLSFDSLGFDQTTLTVTAKVKYRFTGPLTGNLRVNLYIIEDSVTGSGQGYNQANYDNATPGHPYQGAGNPIVGYVHRHVFRGATGGQLGTPNVIQTPVNFGGQASHTFTYTLSPDFDLRQISLIATVAQVTGTGVTERRILNGEGLHLLSNLSPVTSIDEERLATGVKVYPNPFSDRVMFTFDLQHNGWIEAGVFDLQGRKVAHLGSGIAISGMQTLIWDGRDDLGNPVANGLYLFRLGSEKESLSRRVMLNR